VSQFVHPVAAVYDRRFFFLIISALIERRYSKLRHYHPAGQLDAQRARRVAWQLGVVSNYLAEGH